MPLRTIQNNRLSRVSGQPIILDMRTNRLEDLKIEAAPYLAVVRQLPHVEQVQVRQLQEPHGETADFIVCLQFGGRVFPLAVELKRLPRLNRMTVEALLHRGTTPGARLPTLFAPHVTPQMGAALAAAGWNFVDKAGNVRLELEPGLLFHVMGRRPPQVPARGRGFGAPGYRALFAILVQPELARLPVREAAIQAGIGKTTFAYTLERMIEEGDLRRTGHGLQVADHPALIDRWVTGYHDILRPRLLQGIYQTQWHVEELEARLTKALGEHEARGARWAWGGGAAAFRITRHYRGEFTVVHVDPPNHELARELQALPAARGNLAVLGIPGPLAFVGAKPGTVHPLLAYAELANADDDRAREAALDLRRQFLAAKE